MLGPKRQFNHASSDRPATRHQNGKGRTGFDSACNNCCAIVTLEHERTAVHDQWTRHSRSFSGLHTVPLEHTADVTRVSEIIEYGRDQGLVTDGSLCSTAARMIDQAVDAACFDVLLPARKMFRPYRGHL